MFEAMAKYFIYGWVVLGLMHSVAIMRSLIKEKEMGFLGALTVFYIAVLLGPIGIVIVLSDDYELRKKKPKEGEPK